MRFCFLEKYIHGCGQKEEAPQHNGSVKKNFFKSSFCAIDIPLAAERRRKAGSPLLEENRGNKQYRSDDLNNRQY